jgi:predicted nucleic acid-binding protein
MILVDTSVWIDHFRRGDFELTALLAARQVEVHPFVIAELALGSLKDRSKVLQYLSGMPKAKVASHEEVMHMVETRGLFGQGIGYVDAHLLASALLGNSQLLTKDKRLLCAARPLSVLPTGH